jgi:hypothetical protein
LLEKRLKYYDHGKFDRISIQGGLFKEKLALYKKKLVRQKLEKPDFSLKDGLLFQFQFSSLSTFPSYFFWELYISELLITKKKGHRKVDSPP